MTQQITITKPDDWHLHVRDGAALNTVVPHTAAEFGRAVIMPNLRPPVTTAAQALAYKERILDAVPQGVSFEPLMTLYLTDNLPADEIARAKDAGVVAAKLYPAGATTNSAAGVTAIDKVYPVLERMEKLGLVLCVHGEATGADVEQHLVRGVDVPVEIQIIRHSVVVRQIHDRPAAVGVRHFRVCALRVRLHLQARIAAV